VSYQPLVWSDGAKLEEEEEDEARRWALDCQNQGAHPEADQTALNDELTAL
jgi:hypothetical protein